MPLPHSFLVSSFKAKLLFFNGKGLNVVLTETDKSPQQVFRETVFLISPAFGKSSSVYSLF